MKIKKQNPLLWIFEPLEEDPSYQKRKMFGCEAAYVHGLLVMVLAEGEEPWNGMMLATSRDQHESLMRDFEGLAPHPILGKWLYVSQRDVRFEALAEKLVRAIRKADPRIGVEPKPRKSKKKKSEVKNRNASSTRR